MSQHPQEGTMKAGDRRPAGLTGQEEVEQALQASEDRFAKIFQATPAAMSLGHYEGVIFEINHSFERIFGYSREEIIGKSPTDLNIFVNPLDRAEVRRQIETQGYIRNHEVVLRNKAGEILYCTLSIETIVLNQKPCLLVVTHDITSQKQAEQALRESQERLQAALTASGTGTFLWNIRTNALNWDTPLDRLFGLEGEQTAQSLDQWVALIYPDDRPEFVARCERCAQEGVDFEMEFRVVWPDGSLHWLYDRGKTTMGEDGQPLYMAGACVDITTRKQAEEELRRSEANLRARETELRHLNQTLEQRVAERTAQLERSFQELDQFVYVASHDLKAPLRGVNHLANWIIEDAGELLPPESRVHLDKLQGRIKRMEKLLDDLLVYSRVDRRYYQAVEAVDTRVLLKEIVDMLAPPPDFSITVREEMPTLTTHRVLLELVFKNLIENAIKHHHQAKGQIIISAQETNGFFEFTVADDGPGIKEAFYERIFQIFQKLQPRDQVEGSGVGLAIVKKAVESQGGTIGVHSVPGQGTTFRFTWPKAKNGTDSG